MVLTFSLAMLETIASLAVLVQILWTVALERILSSTLVDQIQQLVVQA
jgi:hypothetical protein